MKSFKPIAIIIGVLGLLFIFARVTGAINMYTLPVPSNEPTIKAGSIIYTSNLIEPKRNQFIVYEATFQGKPVPHVFRMVAQSGDTLVIKNGDVFVNGEMTDKGFERMFQYHMPLDKYNEIKEELEHDELGVMPFQENVVLHLTRSQAMKFDFIKPMGELFNDDLNEAFSSSWTRDNFGPYVVPENSYFVLGDSRHNALDSRYAGPISKDDFIATVLFR